MVGMKTTYTITDNEVLDEFKELVKTLTSSPLVDCSYKVDGSKAELSYTILKEHSHDDGEIKPLLRIALFQHKFSKFETAHETI